MFEATFAARRFINVKEKSYERDTSRHPGYRVAQQRFIAEQRVVAKQRLVGQQRIIAEQRLFEQQPLVSERSVQRSTPDGLAAGR
ncbi:hypothetical protein [Trinickia fusca]|uniref:hypothetical protein n=1 Tax=Trinickia fusca TaxID=2419777 RepID=UPI0016023448|nr:hypothetical protein [Trinickia fusca]